MCWCCLCAKTAKPSDVGGTVHIQKPLDCREVAGVITWRDVRLRRKLDNLSAQLRALSEILKNSDKNLLLFIRGSTWAN